MCGGVTLRLCGGDDIEAVGGVTALVITFGHHTISG